MMRLTMKYSIMIISKTCIVLLPHFDHCNNTHISSQPQVYGAKIKIILGGMKTYFVRFKLSTLRLIILYILFLAQRISIAIQRGSAASLLERYQ